MRLRLAAFTACLFVLLPARNVMAQARITDIQGREVRIRPAAAAKETQRVAKATSRRPIANAIVTVNAGPDVSAAVNDYRRIQGALNAAGNGDTIILSGTFDFTQPFAAAAWALGNDNTAATADDYEVLAPRGVNNVTLTANSLGSATIQGPGDLAAVNLEPFLVFDPSVAPGGTNQGWTISNLRILDFDLSIGMFAVGVSDFNNTTIQNNFIRIPTDLNATVAPVDVNQNIGIHFSFGTNQSILGNSFQIPGDGVSDTGAGKFSSSVVMQSNTSGGNVYNGLNIANNVTHVLNAQSANPQTTIGIWENGHAHTSNITVSNNSFINDAAGNDKALNLERGFRVTSHSGAATLVTYDLNHVDGANIGFQWLAGANFTGNQAVVLSNNQITNSDTGVLVQSNGIAHLTTDVITGSGSGAGVHVITGTLTGSGANTNSIFRSVVSGGSADGILIDATAGTIAPMSQNDLSSNAGFALHNLSAAQVPAELNWWGSNLAANVAATVSGNVDFDPWLASGTDVSAAFGFQPFIYATTTGTTTTLAGTAAADTGAALAGNPITLQMDGDTGFVPSAQLLSLDIRLGGSDDFFTLGALGVPTTLDAGTGNDTLVGTNIAQTWNITGANSGAIPGVTTSFANVEALRGGTASDSFVFGAAGSVAQTIDGNLGSDTLDNSAIPGHIVTPTGPGTLDGFMGTATGVGTTFDNINVIAAAADMAVTKTGPATATAGTVISYTITVMNNGPNPAINASLTDTLPAGTTFSSLVSPGGWSCITPAVGAGGTVTCTQPSLAVGSAVFTLNVNGPAAPAGISNTASVSSASADSTPGNNNSTANTNVIFTADLSLTKTATATAAAGTNVTYGLTLTNNGPSPATNVSLTDALPANTTFVSESQTTGPALVCINPSVGANGTVTCTNASLASGASATFTIVVNVAGNAPAGTLNNTADATTTSTDPTTPNTSTAGTTITPGNADLSITKTPQPGPYATVGSLNYTIVVANAGPGSAANVVVTDVLPAGTTFVSAIPSQGSCSGTTTVTCTLGTLANAASATINLTVTLPSSPGSVSNTASVATTNVDPNSGNNASTSTITVVSASSIPAASPMVLLLLGIALAMAGLVVQRLE